METPLVPPRRSVAGTVFSAFLLTGGVVAMLAVSLAFSHYRNASTDLETLPPASTALLGVVEHHGLEALVAVLALPAVLLLIAGKRRWRANLYAGFVGLGLGFSAIVLFFVALLPLIRIIKNFGDAS